MLGKTTLFAQTSSDFTKDILKGNRYFIFSNELNISFNMATAFNSGSVEGDLLEIKSKNKVTRTLMIDWEKGSPLNIFLHINQKLHKYSLKDVSLDSLSKVTIEINFKKDCATITINNSTINISGLHLSINEGYAFQLLPHLANVSTATSDPQLTVSNIKIKSNRIEAPGNPIYWFLAIILIDIIIFIFIFTSKKRKNKELSLNDDEIFGENTLKRVTLPEQSAIYMFGGLKIFDKEGVEISHKLSPLLKELLTLLIISSDGNGITSTKMKEILWFDKSAESARNNRSVYIKRLRDLFATIGNNIVITNENGYWKIEAGDTFIDYLEYRKLIIQEGVPQKTDIEMIISITNNGGLLPDCEYLWLDNYKGNVSSDIIDKLLQFAELDAMKNNVGVYFAVAKAISNIESLNEDSLKLRCKAFSLSGRHQSAKSTYDRFCQEYNTVYGEPFGIAFRDIVNN